MGGAQLNANFIGGSELNIKEREGSHSAAGRWLMPVHLNRAPKHRPTGNRKLFPSEAKKIATKSIFHHTNTEFSIPQQLGTKNCSTDTDIWGLNSSWSHQILFKKSLLGLTCSRNKSGLFSRLGHCTGLESNCASSFLPIPPALLHFVCEENGWLSWKLKEAKENLWPNWRGCVENGVS